MSGILSIWSAALSSGGGYKFYASSSGTLYGANSMSELVTGNNPIRSNWSGQVTGWTASPFKDFFNGARSMIYSNQYIVDDVGFYDMSLEKWIGYPGGLYSTCEPAIDPTSKKIYRAISIDGGKYGILAYPLYPIDTTIHDASSTIYSGLGTNFGHMSGYARYLAFNSTLNYIELIVGTNYGSLIRYAPGGTSVVENITVGSPDTAGVGRENTGAMMYLTTGGGYGNGDITLHWSSGQQTANSYTGGSSVILKLHVLSARSTRITWLPKLNKYMVINSNGGTDMNVYIGSTIYDVLNNGITSTWYTNYTSSYQFRYSTIFEDNITGHIYLRAYLMVQDKNGAWFSFFQNYKSVDGGLNFTALAGGGDWAFCNGKQ